MKPLKNLIVLSAWMLRLVVLSEVYQRFFDTIVSFSFKGLNFFIALTMATFAVVLFLSGFTKKPTLPIIAGFMITAISVALMFNGGITVEKVLNNFIVAAIGVVFMARGNS